MATNLKQRIVVLVGLPFALVGLALLAVGVGLGASRLLPDDARATTTATITGLGANTTVISYEVDGTAYEARLGESFSSDTLGKQIEVSYDRADPSDVRSRRSGILLLGVFGGLGAAFLILGSALLLATWASRRRQARLLVQGTPIQAQITGVEPDRSAQVNSRHLWRIRCEGTPPGSAVPVAYASEGWAQDPTPLLQQLGLTSLTVYVDPARPQRSYAVDDARLREQAAAGLAQA